MPLTLIPFGPAAERSEKIAEQSSSSANSLRSARPTGCEADPIDVTNSVRDGAAIPFDPVPVRPRHDGWTVDRQYDFITALAETGMVEAACRRVGMSRSSADKLRWRADGAHFRRAWEMAIDYAMHRIEEDAHRRAREGVARPIFYQGEQVGEWRHFDERLTMFLLRTYRPERYGRAVAVARPDSDGQDGPEDPGITLDGGLSAIEWQARDVCVEDDEDGASHAL